MTEKPNKPGKKDICKSAINIFIAALYIVLTINLVIGAYNAISGNGTGEQKPNVQTIDKDIEKTVNGKTEKTKETQIVDNTNVPLTFNQWLTKKLSEVSLSGVILQTILFGLGIAALKAILIVLDKDVSTINVFGFGAGAASQEAAVIASENIEKSAKLDVLAYYSAPDFKEEFYAAVQIDKQGEPEAKDFLDTISKVLVDVYEEELNIYMDYQIIEMQKLKNSKLPRKVKKSLNEMEANNGIAIGKDPNMPYHKNYLVCRVKDSQNTFDYAVIFDSYKSIFDNDDEIVVTNMFSIAQSSFFEFLQSRTVLLLRRQILELRTKITTDDA
jgi:hypothetical protein